MLALAGRKLHPHPLIADDGMADARLKELTLLLGALDIGEAALVYPALLVACVFVLFFTLYNRKYDVIETDNRGILTIMAQRDCSCGFMLQW